MSWAFRALFYGGVGDRSYTLEADVDDEGVRGVMRFVEVLRWKGRANYTCDSGDVAFSAPADQS